MKVLIVTPFFMPHVGGSQQYMEDLYATLVKKHQDVSADVLCYNTDQVKTEEDYRGMHIFRLPCWSVLPGQFVLPEPVALLRFLWSKRKAYDLIHVSTRFFETAWWAPIFAKLIRRPIFLTDHCAYHPVHPNLLIRSLTKLLDHSLIWLCLHGYSRIYATNKATQGFLKTDLGIQSTVMYGGVDLKQFQISDLKIKNLSSERRLVIAYVGRMIDSKGVIVLWEIAKKHPEYDFLFVGPGELAILLKEKIKQEQIRHISILGIRSKAEVAQILSQTAIFVHPSFHHEGLPNSILEAGAMGLPVIATDNGGTREIIIPGETGILVPMKDHAALEEAILRLAKDKMLRKTLARNLYAHIQKQFTWETISEEMYQALKQFCV